MGPSPAYSPPHSPERSGRIGPMTELGAIGTPRRTRLRRLVPACGPATQAAERSPGQLELALAALWFGLATGLLELGLTLALEPVYDEAPGLFRGNRHILWIIPMVDLAVFAACGGLLALLARLRPR